MLFTTRYLEAAITELAHRRNEVRDADAARLSPSHHVHAGPRSFSTPHLAAGLRPWPLNHG